MSEAEIKAIRDELEIVQRALRLQTRRCRQLVTEYTKRLQLKEQQYQSEKQLRDNQLANVLRALLIFEARLKQEQKYITHQLKTKDYIIKKQKHELSKLLACQYCKHCNQSYSPVSQVDSIEDSSLEYACTQDSNMESLDSSSENYATMSEKDFYMKKHNDFNLSGDENCRSETGSLYTKNKNSFGRRGKKLAHRKSISNYFEVLKMKNDNASSVCSNEDNTSNDYENFDSLPSETITDKINSVSERIENILATNENLKQLEEKEDNERNDSISSNVSESDCNNTVIQKDIEDEDVTDNERMTCKITENIPHFEGDDNERTDNWYASASDQEDDDQRDVYRNNPVLECMNQILLQNINDTLNSPPKTPNVERKANTTKRVKFRDEEDAKIIEKDAQIINTTSESGSNYYETPIQKQPNFYETPQSIYSNDYEQIMSSKGSNSNYPVKENSNKTAEVKEKEHYYVDMETKEDPKIIRKSKILRTPPALPPKPSNLVSKYKIQNLPPSNTTNKKHIALDLVSVESDPDYCSISELNLPNTIKKINVIAEGVPQTMSETSSISETQIILHKPKVEATSLSHYDPVDVNSCIPKLVVSKNIEKFNVQIAKQASTKLESPGPPSPKKKVENDIPKLPQVTEIIIPDDSESEKMEPERINHDNYIKNNSQVPIIYILFELY